MGFVLVLLAALDRPLVTASNAQAAADAAPALDLTLPRERTPRSPTACTSVVQRACATETAPDSGSTAPPGRTPTQTADQVLERVVIEGERLKRPLTVREVIEAATTRRTWREFESGEGGRCACAKPCPPWPQACCMCTKGGRDAKINNLVRH